MNTPVPMTKVFVLGMKDQVERTTATLADAKLVHLEKVEKLPDFAKSFVSSKDEDLERKYRVIEEQYRACQSALGISPEADIQASDLAFDLSKEAGQLTAMVAEVYQECEKHTGRLKDIRDEEKHLSQIRNLMELLRGLDLDLGAFRRMQFMRATMGIVAQDKLGLLREGLKGRFVLTDRKVRPGEHLVMIVGDLEDQPLLDKVLAGAFFEELVVPEEFLGNPSEILKKIEARLNAIVLEKEKISRALAEIKTRYASALTTLSKKVHCADLHFFARDHFKSSKETLILTGWLPKDKVKDLKSLLATRNNGQELLVLEDDKAAAAKTPAPTLLKHSWLVRPFENILKIYGLPNYRELDPTVYTTIGFILMFGMMFGDIGHGLFLFSIGAWLRWGKKGRKSPMLKEVGFLLLACGTISTIFGFLYGSIFGFEHVVHALWYNPFEELNYGLIVAIGWGVAFILGGALLSIVNRVRNGKNIEALLGRTGVAGIWFYLGSIALVVGILAGIEPLKGFGALAALCLAPMVLIGLKEPLEVWHHARQAKKAHAAGHDSHEAHAKPALLEIFILSFMEIYETILTYLSNTLSFMRVAAFALNHIALLMAVFAIAQIIRDSTGSGVFYWVMVGIGNLAVIGLEGMIVTIQTLRLIYYEGFSKFFSGDGVEYRPFSVSSSIK